DDDTGDDDTGDDDDSTPEPEVILPGLDGSQSYDLDGNLSTYYWTDISASTLGPALEDPTSEFPVLRSHLVGITSLGVFEANYTYQLEVTDCSGASSTDTVQVTFVCEVL
ncbi:MAG TPA: hypothetical protein DIU15_21195, partial [Deltaproteobacteria bacterium]|nr:hypothetical protein [Deltaproteobacteria bacterium]